MADGHLETERRRDQFVIVYAATGNATAAAVAAGYSVKSARQQGAVLMADPSLAAYARDAREAFLADRRKALEDAMSSLVEGAPEAIKSLRNLADKAKSEMARVNAATAILLYAGLKPPERVESKNEHTFTAPDSNEVDSRLDRLFGTSGPGASASGDRQATH